MEQVTESPNSHSIAPSLGNNELSKTFYDHSHDKPSKISHIKNPKFLDNTLNPLNNRYIKKIWSHHINKNGRDNRHLIWEYYSDRNKHHIAETLLKTHYLNVSNVSIIYFSDPIEYEFLVTPEIATELKDYNRRFNEHKKLLYPKKIKIKKEKKKLSV